MSSALERCVGDIERFVADHWGRAPLLTRNASSFADVFCLDDVDKALSTAVRRPAVRLIKNGIPVDPRSYVVPTRLGGRDLDDVVDPAQVARRFREGATVVLQSLHRSHAGVSDFVAALEAEISHPLQANAYLTPPNATGLTPHRDDHAVLVVQLSGSKQWSVDGVGDFTIAEGDCLYVPGATTHSARTNDVASLHLTIGIMTVTYRAVLERILRNETTCLDRPLPLDYRRSDTDDMADSLANVLSEVATKLAAVDANAVTDRERSRRRALRPRPGSFSYAAGLATPRHEQLIRWSASGATIRPANGQPSSGETFEIVTRNRTVTLPARARTAVGQIIDGPVAVGELAGLDAESQVVVAARLAEEMLCCLEPPTRSVRDN
jgi:mannose-6-phosphate isomerase-like protein (cupin superfamily)